MKTVINENQVGLLFQNGVLKKILSAGKYITFGGKTIEVLPIDEEISSKKCSLKKILECPNAKGMISQVNVKNGCVCLHYKDDVFEEALTAGLHAFWNGCGTHDFEIYSTENPKITDIPNSIAVRLGTGFVVDVNVLSETRTVICYNGKVAEYLEPGRYFYWNCAVKVTASSYSMRVQQLDINSQEILTKDRVGVRVNFSANWKISDYKKLYETYPNINVSLYTAAQLALRDYLGGKTMDELLSDRENIGNEIIEVLKKRTEGMYVEIISGGIRDVILPGEISAIMNSVLAAEKRAQANVITRREEVASTRSLLNTAKLMDENSTLRRLKELEYIEKICENVGEITVDARSSILSQLTHIISGNDDN